MLEFSVEPLSSLRFYCVTILNDYGSWAELSFYAALAELIEARNAEQSEPKTRKCGTKLVFIFQRKTVFKECGTR